MVNQSKKINQLREEILSNEKKQESDDIILEIHNGFMMNYGWISLKEFKELPIPTVLNLLDKLKETFEKTKT